MDKNVNPKPEQNANNIFNAPVRVGRDFIAGNQINLAPPENREEFLTQLQQVQAQINEIKKGGLTPSQTKILELAEEKVSEAVSEANQPHSRGESIKAALAEAKETMDLLSGSLTSAATLGTIIGGLILTAMKLFGG
jgi:hypothetical protein